MFSGQHRRHPAPSGATCRVAVGVAAFLAVGISTSACGGDDGPSAERFCGAVDENRVALTDPDLVTDDDIQPLLELYRSVGELAPLSIEEDWDRLTIAYETASTVVPGDEESEQTALRAIFSTEKSAAAVDRWLTSNCAVDIGPVFTIVEQDPPSTVLPTPTTAPE